jgi:integrase
VWHGRFYIDVAGQERRKRRSIPIGSAVGHGKLTKSGARNKLQEYLQELGAAGYRDVDIHPDVMAMLKKHIGDRQTGLVFTGRRGKPLVVGNVNEYVLKPTLKKLELPHGTTHAMRHGAVSRFQEAGVHGDLITKWVGHTSLKRTSKYTHFSAKHRKEAVAKLGAIAS